MTGSGEELGSGKRQSEASDAAGPAGRSYEALVFDLDRTLIEHDQRPDAVFRTACEAIGIEPFCGADTLELAAEMVGRQSEALDARTFEQRMFRTIGTAAGVDIDAEELAMAYEDALDNTTVSLRTGARKALEAATAYDSAIVTNGPERTHARKLAAVDVADCFDTILFRSDVNRVKPAREPFELALDRLGVAPDEALKIGDSLHKDVGGATNLGIDTAWIPWGTRTRDERDREPTYHLSTLAELPEILE